MILEIVKQIARKGLRVIRREDIATMAISLGLKPSYARKLHTILAQKGELEYLGKGLYALPSSFYLGAHYIHSKLV